MCEGSFLPSSFGPHQKHTEFESSLRSYPIKVRARVLGANLGDTDLLPSFRTYPSMISAEDRGRSSEYVSGWWPLAAFLQRCGFGIANTSPVKHHHPSPPT